MVEANFEGQVLVINTKGGGIAQYYQIIEERRHDIIYGYDKQEDSDGSMGEILSPFPGRVEKGEYDWEDIHYKLKGFFEKGGNPLHAFVRESEWSVKNAGPSSITSRLDISGDRFSANGYPFSLKYEVKYDLGKDGLTVTTNVTNIGLRSAPFGIGFHPYFKTAVQVDEMVWHVPAKNVLEFDPSLKPTGKLLKVEDTKLDFREARAIGGIEIDNCFTELIRDKKGIFVSTLSNLTGTKQIKVWQDKSYPYFQAYSADTIADRNYRQAMALEPQSCCGYAVNVKGLGLIDLKPGKTFTGKWGVSYTYSSSE